ncbi:hypothetical protein ROZALSC1DRAFT_22803, partial [Rozella allomycis CSF55]
KRDEVLDKVHESRLRGKSDKEQGIKIRKKRLEENELVLLYDSYFQSGFGKKFKDKFQGPYRISKNLQNGAYVLKELDGTLLQGTYHGNRLKKFNPRKNEDIQFKKGEHVVEHGTDELNNMKNLNINNNFILSTPVDPEDQYGPLVENFYCF